MYTETISICSRNVSIYLHETSIAFTILLALNKCSVIYFKSLTLSLNHFLSQYNFHKTYIASRTPNMRRTDAQNFEALITELYIRGFMHWGADFRLSAILRAVIRMPKKKRGERGYK